MSIQRTTNTQPFAVPASAAGKGFDFGSHSSGEVRNLSGNSITTLTWYCGDTIDGPWYACSDVSATPVAAGAAIQIPVGLFGCHYLLPVGDAAGTINLDLKS